jgi:hypothetical protein
MSWEQGPMIGNADRMHGNRRLTGDHDENIRDELEDIP